MTMLLTKCFCIIILANFILADFECSKLCDSGTCCKDDSGKMLCCPASGGVCCAFSKTCCPPGTLCDADGLCSKANSGFFGLMNYFTSQKQIQTEAPTIESPVLKSCLTFCGDLCCGFKNGVCCDDGEHCCPSGYVCDGASQSCRLSLPDPIPKPLNGGRNCLFSKSDCRNSQTCCILTDGSKGCCPYQNADCCADGAHCCPEGTVCNSDSSACVRRSGAWVDPFKPSPKLLGRKSVVCPGGEVACNRGSTCCKSGAGGDSSYSCCPHENAVCCGDGEHCCPEGYTCDPTNGGLCVRLSSSVVPKSLKESRVGNECADGQSVCPDETTCCALESGKYACCPLPDAVCCEDHEHCCPNGYKCDVVNNICVQKTDISKFVTIFKKFTPASVSDDEKVFKYQPVFKPWLI